MNLLFTVCGRAGSKGIKNKNFKQFLGDPLPFYSFSVIDLFMRAHSEHNCDIALNTDSIELKNLIADHVNRPVTFVKRKSELAMDHSPKVPVIADTLMYMENAMQISYDMVIDLDITSPLRTLKDLENIILKKENAEGQVVFSVVDSRRNPYFNMVKFEDNRYAPVIHTNISARQQAPQVYDMNASLYAYDPQFLRTGKAIFDVKFDVIKMLDTFVLDLDHENDFEFMQIIAEHLFKTRKEFADVKENIGFILKN